MASVPHRNLASLEAGLVPSVGRIEKELQQCLPDLKKHVQIYNLAHSPVHLFLVTFLSALVLGVGSARMAAWAFWYIPSMLS